MINLYKPAFVWGKKANVSLGPDIRAKGERQTNLATVESITMAKQEMSITAATPNSARRSELLSSHHEGYILTIVLVFVICLVLVGLAAINCDNKHNHSLVKSIGINHWDDQSRANSKTGHASRAVRVEPNDDSTIASDSRHQAMTSSFAEKLKLERKKNEKYPNGISAKAAAFDLDSKYEPIVLPLHRERSLASSGQWVPVRIKRAAGRSKSGRIQLAQRPKSTTTTTTSATTVEDERSGKIASPEESSAAQLQEDVDKDRDESSDSDDYEDIEPSKSKPKSKSKAKADSGAGKKTAPGRKDQDAEAEDERGDENGEENEEGEEDVEDEATTIIATTTTQRATTARKAEKSSAGGRKDATSRSKGGAQKASERVKSSSKQTSKLSKIPVKEATDKGVDDEVDEVRRKEEENSEAVRKQQKKNETSQIESTLMGSTLMESAKQQQYHHHHKKPLVALPFIRQKNLSICTPEAYLEFPRDLIGDKWRSRGLILVHLVVVCYMFYSLALVCERYFMPSLEEFAQRLQISEDVAGATLMSAGSSAPELFTAILGVFVAKGDVGTGAIVGSAVFNILFVIGICAFVSTTTAQLQWWPVLRDSVYYTFTVLVLILIIYDERITALESASMICLYGVYIAIMVHNETLKELATGFLLSNPLTAKLISSITIDGLDDVFGNSTSSATTGSGGFSNKKKDQTSSMATTIIMNDMSTVEEDSIYLAACLVIVRHKRLFKCKLRFQSAARYIIVKRQHKMHQQRLQALKSKQNQIEEVNYFGPEDEPFRSSQRAKMDVYARNASLSKNKFSIVSKDDYEFWHRPPEEGENYYLWLAKIPVNYVLHYTIPDSTLYPDKYVLSFIMSILWTAFFSYIMVWMVTIIGYTLGIPDSVMGVTFLAAGTSVPDCYSSIHAARNGMADMAVSNSIGSNVFDILIGLAVPWFIQSAIYPGVVATINSRGVIYSVILLFLSLIVTIYLMYKCDWNLQPRLGLALIIAYTVFIILTCMLEFNLFGHVNPPPCPQAAGTNY